MATDASQLLSILRGTSSPPPVPSSSSSNSPSSNPTALDLLFNKAFINSKPNTSGNNNNIDEADVPSAAVPELEQKSSASSSLLSLLKAISKAPATPTIVSTSPAPSTIPVSSSSALLAQIMGTLPPTAQDSTKVHFSEEEVNKPTSTLPILTNTTVKPIVSPSPLPAFTFVSPFDILSASNEKKLPSSNYSPSTVVSNLPVEHVHVAIPTAASNSKTMKVLDIPTPAAPASSLNRDLLACNILATSTEGTTVSSPIWAPKGVRVPEPRPSSSSSSLPEKLRIDIAEEHLESLSLDKVEVQPVTIFTNEMKWEKGRKVASWSDGIAYATKGGKIRVIDRISGGRILLKGHTTQVIEVVVSSGVELVEGVETRSLASVGADGRLIVWRVGNQSIDQIPSKKIIDVQDGSFTLVKFHPHFPAVPTLAVVKQDGTFLLVNTVAAVEGISDITLLNAITQSVDHGAPIIDIDFSPDGHKIAILDSNRTLSIRSLNNPLIVIEALVIKAESHDPSGIHLLSTGVIVSSQQGTEYSIITLGAPHNETHQTCFVLPSLKNRSQHFGHSTFHSASRTLFVSSSLRGSLFALSLSSDNARISHVLEIPTLDPIIGFYLDDSIVNNTLSALIVHSEGINLITFDHKIQDNTSLPSPTLSNDDDDAERVGRRMSLEASILVESQTQIKVDEADLDAINSTPCPSKLTQRRPSVNPVPEEEILEPVVVPEIISSLPPLYSTASTTPAATNLPPKKNGKQSAIGATPPLLDERMIKQESPATASPTLAKTVSDLWASGGNNNTGGGGGGKKGGKNDQSSSVEVMKELKRLEESIPARVAKLVAKELEKRAGQLTEEKENAEAAELSRQETSFKVLVASLSKVTSKQLEISIKDQIKSQVVPSLGQLVSTAVADQVSKGIESALHETLPNELASLLHRPEISQHLARNFSSTIGPLLEKNITQVVVSSVIPIVNSSINSSFEKLVRTLRMDMLEVRKEIVKEQSGALETTEREVIVLREDLRNVKATLARMEGLLLNLSSTPPLPSSRRIPSSQVSSLPPIPRSETPQERYEEIFTNALQPSNEPGFVSLLNLINSSPVTRIEAVFPASSRPRISPPVVLSLAYRLSSVISSRKGKLDEEGRKQLQYIRKCVTAMDGKDSETLAYTPKILESVCEGLNLRGKELLKLKDMRGAEEMRTVEVYARARFDLVSQRSQL